MDPDKVQGDVQRPYQQEPEQSDKIDPEKFKKVMKVDESDEAQKRHKRNLKREEEEGEDEEVEDKGPTPPQASTSFSEFMSDKDELDNLFDKQSGGIRRQVEPEEQSSFVAPQPGSINTEGVELDDEEEPSTSVQAASGSGGATTTGGETSQQPPPQAPPSEGSSSGGYQQEGETPLYEGGGLTEESYTPEQTQPQRAPQQSQQEAFSGSSTESTEDGQVSESQEKEKGGEQPASHKKEEDASLLASQPKLGALKPKKKKKATGPAPEEKIVPQEKAPPQEKGKVQEKVSLQEGPAHQREVFHGETETVSKGIDKTDQKAPRSPQKEREHGEVTPHILQDQKTKEHIPTDLEGVEGTETKKTSPIAVPSKDEMAGDLSDEGKNAKQGVTNFETPEEAPSAPAVALRGPTKEEGAFRRLSPQEVRQKRLAKASKATSSAIEGMVVPSAGEGEKGQFREGKKEKEEEGNIVEASAESASITLPTFDTPLAPITPPDSTPEYSKLSPEVYELFEKMGGVMTIKQDEGITTTTMKIAMPNSVFDGSEIILEKYDTAPHSYNLQLVGSPEAVKRFSDNLPKLNTAFKEANFNFDVNLLTPSLSRPKKPPHLIRRKGSAGGKGGGGKQSSS